MENEKYNNIIEYLKENVNVISDLVSECNSWNSSLEDYEWLEHDEYFYDTYFKDKDEVARAVYYGGDNYRYTDPYVRFNAYGNLNTCCEWEREKDLIDGVEYIFDTWLELYGDNNVDCYDDKFKELIRCFYDEESEDNE